MAHAGESASEKRSPVTLFADAGRSERGGASRVEGSGPKLNMRAPPEPRCDHGGAVRMPRGDGGERDRRQGRGKA
uniref:Uncharacterized protein n=1 Tax=Tetraselmis sp. GSL018 TaxID=582737 RepID=A0A061S9X1_9CHLO